MALKATKEVKFRVQEIDFRAYQIIRIQELPGASPPGPPPGLCPGPTRGLTHAPLTTRVFSSDFAICCWQPRMYELDMCIIFIIDNINFKQIQQGMYLYKILN